MSASLNDRPNRVEVTGDAATVIVGGAGTQGVPGVGVPAGGATNDILVKNSGTDYDTEWTATPTVDSLQFDTTAAIEPDAAGEVAWDTAEGTIAVGLQGGGVVGRLMEHSFYRVQADEAISKGDLCMAVGTVGNSGVILTAKARTSYGALTNIPSQRLMGLAAGNIAQGATGLVVAFGKVRKINTAAFAEGDILYADPTVPGGLTATQPTAPNWRTIIALCVTDSATVGELFVRPTFGPNLANDEAVTLTSPVDGDVLTYDGTVWRNEAPAAAGIPATIIDAKGDLIVGTAADTAARLAVGTINGQRLVVASASSSGQAWETDHTDVTFRPSGYYHAPPQGVALNATHLLSSNAIYYWPFSINVARTVNALGSWVTGLVASSTFQVGIYSSTNYAPASRLLTSGNLSSASTGWKEATGLSTVLQPGTYWLAVGSASAITLRALTVYAVTLGFDTSNGSRSMMAVVQSTGYTTELPATAGTVSLSSTAGTIATGFMRFT